MKFNIAKFQEGGQLAPWVGYSPFFQPMTQESGTQGPGSSNEGSSRSTSKVDSSQKQLKDIIGQIVGKGLTNEVNNFASEVGDLFADSELLEQPVTVRQYTALVSKLNEIQNNKNIYDQAKEHAISKGTLSEAAIDYSGNLFAQDSKGRLVIISPYQYSEDKENFRLLTNNDLLTLRNVSPAYMYDNTLSQTVAGSININDIAKRVEDIVKQIGTEKESSDYYFDKAKANKLQQGLQAIVNEKLNTAPDGTYKMTNEVTTQRKNINLALNYIWNNLDQQSRNTLIARASVNTNGDPMENALEGIKDILIFGTDHAQSQSIQDEKVADGSGSGSGSSGGLTDINPLMSYASDPKTQDYLIHLGGDYSFRANASIRPLIGSKGEVLNENYMSDIMTDGGLGSLLDVSGSSVGFGDPLNPNDLSKILYQGDRIAMTWLPYKRAQNGSKVVDLNLLEKLEDANEEIASLGNNLTQDQKFRIYEKYGVEDLIVINNTPTSEQLNRLHQFMVIPSYIPEEVAEETGLDKKTQKLTRSEEKKVRDMYARVKSKLENRALRANGYIPDTYLFIPNDDIYKSSLFIPVQDELASTLFTGKTAPLVPKSRLTYENVINNVSQVTNPQGLNQEAFK